MPILNIDLIKKAVKHINKCKENVIIKKGQSYIIGNDRVTVKTFDGNNVHLTINSNHYAALSTETVVIKNNLIKAIQNQDLNIVFDNEYDSAFKKRIEAISASPVNKTKMTDYSNNSCGEIQF